MSLAQKMLNEFDHEMANTRRVLERVPADKFQYRPHPKSAAMGGLASHVAGLPGYATTVVKTEFLDVASGGGRTKQAQNSEELLRIFDESVRGARAALEGCSDEEITKPWSLRAGEKKIFELPRIAALRAFCLNHLIHHRAQLGVYLRLNDIPVPGMYGPSADEPM